MLIDAAEIARLDEARQSHGVARVADVAEPLAGGFLCFAGPGSWANQAFGLAATRMIHATPTLAAESCTASVFIWSLVLIILLVIGAAGVMRLRRWMKEDDKTPTGGIGFTLSDLRQLHKQGQMTDEEFERARAKMVEAGRAMAAKMPHPLSRPADPSGQNRPLRRPQPPQIDGREGGEDQ